jgi:hypothetical protein
MSGLVCQSRGTFQERDAVDVALDIHFVASDPKDNSATEIVSALLKPYNTR